MPTAFVISFRLRRMHEMQTILADVCGDCPVTLSVTVMWLNLAAGVCRGHLVQPLPNDFGLLFSILFYGDCVKCTLFQN